MQNNLLDAFSVNYCFLNRVVDYNRLTVTAQSHLIQTSSRVTASWSPSSDPYEGQKLNKNKAPLYYHCHHHLHLCLPGSRQRGTATCPAGHRWWSESSSARSRSHSPEARWSSASPVEQKMAVVQQVVTHVLSSHISVFLHIAYGHLANFPFKIIKPPTICLFIKQTVLQKLIVWIGVT